MYRIVFVVVLFFIQSFFSQELPPISVFYTEDYEAENQNWAISQSNEGYIYIANNKGLLEYNGASWSLYETPNETIMRSVKVINDKIFTGFYMDFGFWEKDVYGILKYTSIVNKYAIEMLEDEQIWNIVEVDDWVIFKSLQKIYLYNLKTEFVKTINSDFKLNKLTKVNGIIYFQENKKGLFKIENGEPKLVSDDNVCKESVFVDIFEKENKLHIVTQKNGFYYLENNKAIPWVFPSSNQFDNKVIYSAKYLKDNSLAIGTISNGLFKLNENGEIVYQVDQSSGINDNTVLSIFEDKDNNIWLGLDNGIDYINNKSAFKIHNKKAEFLGTIYTSIIHNDTIYLGTNQGLFYKKLNSTNSFKFIKNTRGQVWSLEVINNTLFCGHDSGTFVVNNSEVKSIFNNQGTWSFLKINDSTIIQGTYDGLCILKKLDGIWGFSHKINGFNNSSKFIVESNNTFFINHEYKGVFKIKFDTKFENVTELKKVTSLEKGIHSSIIKYRDDILYANKNGVFSYNSSKDSFEKDSIYSKLITKESFISAKLVYNKGDEKLWFFSKDRIKYISPGKISSKPIINTIYLSESLPKAASGYENILNLYDDIYLIGTSNGYLQIDIKKIKSQTNFKVYINRINKFKTDVPKERLNILNNVNLDNDINNLEFYYSVPHFNRIIPTKYQYILEGLQQNWSDLSNSSSVVFENIPPGDYTFKVKAFIGDNESSNIAVYNFTINRPWYFSNIMVVLYILLSISALYSVHIASKRYYRKQREILLEKAKKDAELKELESTQKLIKLNNEKLRNDIENKSKELASSTMNMIKKNEFLNTIKNELVVGGEKSVSKVVKIIDKNLNNTDDWKMFQEAFNNADKDFLKKVKDKHPVLTPNDLRLCAYLRLNLSSKEIAPLLNISPRSVEVKRYRLRKKMDLDHNANLTDYIIGL